jgi:hypothetical protein
VMREPDAGRYVHIRPRWLPPECHPQPAPLHVRPDRQGMRDRAEARPRQAGPRRTGQAMKDLDQLRVELRVLMASWEYAFATGHGCSVGDHPQHRAVREKAAHLRARIAEHTPSPSES